MTEILILTRDVLVACILLGLTSLVGLIGNGLMLRALVKYRSLRTDIFLLLGSMAAADILCLLISVPMHIIYLTEATSPVTFQWCKFSKYIDSGSGFVAAYHLVVLAVLRGILLTSRGRNPPSTYQTLLCVSVLWIIGFLASIPFLLTVENVEGYCHYTMDTDVVREIWLLNSFSCFVPIGLILIIYVLTHLVGKRYFEDSYSYTEKKLANLVTVIVAFFIVLQLPFRALDTHVMYKELEAEQMDFPDEDTLESLYIARNYLLCLMIADKAIRPIIYAKLAPGLSEAFDEVINCTSCHRAYTQTRTANVASDHSNDNNDDQQKSRSGRHPSTSSKAPLTGDADASAVIENGDPLTSLK